MIHQIKQVTTKSEKRCAVCMDTIEEGDEAMAKFTREDDGDRYYWLPEWFAHTNCHRMNKVAKNL